jgi:hypothetical protein
MHMLGNKSAWIPWLWVIGIRPPEGGTGLARGACTAPLPPKGSSGCAARARPCTLLTFGGLTPAAHALRAAPHPFRSRAPSNLQPRAPRRVPGKIAVGPHAQATLPAWRPRPASGCSGGGGDGSRGSRSSSDGDGEAAAELLAAAQRWEVARPLFMPGSDLQRQAGWSQRQTQQQMTSHQQGQEGDRRGARPIDWLAGAALAAGRAPPQRSYAWWRNAHGALAGGARRGALLEGALARLDEDMGAELALVGLRAGRHQRGRDLGYVTTPRMTSHVWDLGCRL